MFARLVLVVVAALKFGKLGGTLLTMLISVGVYAMVFGWRYAVGIVAMLFLLAFPGRERLLFLLAVLPGDRVYSLELPLRSEARAGIGPHERLGKCVTAARRLLAQAHGDIWRGDGK